MTSPEGPGARKIELSPEVARATQQAFASLVPHLRQAQEWVAGAAHSLNAFLVPYAQWVRDNRQEIAVAVLTAGNASAPNWKDLTGVRIARLLQLVEEPDGTPLAWLPPSPVLRMTLDVETLSERDTILLREADSISAAAQDLLDEVTADALSDVMAAIRQAWDVWDSGDRLAAQALAAACVTGVIQRPYGLKLERLSQVKDHLRNAIKDQRGNPDPVKVVWRLREAATFTAMETTVRNDKDDRGQPGFNRHQTLHGDFAGQYNDANALRGLMIATAAIRELQVLRGGVLVPLITPATPQPQPKRKRRLKPRPDSAA